MLMKANVQGTGAGTGTMNDTEVGTKQTRLETDLRLNVTPIRVPRLPYSRPLPVPLLGSSLEAPQADSTEPDRLPRHPLAVVGACASPCPERPASIEHGQSTSPVLLSFGARLGERAPVTETR